MATFDNKHWLLYNIRNSFISTDDTGMCEIVMTGENFPKIFYNKALEEKKKLKNLPITDRTLTDIQEDVVPKEIVTEYDPYPDMEESDDEDLMNGSYIRHEDFGPHRQRSNTALWLDKKEQAIKKAAKIKSVRWQNPATELSIEERKDLFPKKQMKQTKSKDKPKSLLADQLEKCPHLPHCEYLEYAKYDGTAQMGLPIKCFKIFMTFLPEKHQNYPLNVCIIANAKIQDLIGFTCYKYSIEHPDISLGSVHKYGLCIAEDDGDIDWAFPCLDTNEPCSKFGFPCLGLIDLKSKTDLPSGSLCMPEDGGLSTAFQMVFPKQESGLSQNYGSRHNTGGSSTSEAVMFAIQSLNEGKKGRKDSETSMSHSHVTDTEAPQYKAYRVQLLHKVRANTPVQLGISLDKIEVEPLINGNNKFWTRTKYFLHKIDTVAWCQIMEAKSNKTTFRLVYSRGANAGYGDRSSFENNSFFHQNSQYKHHDFECDHDTAKLIVDKINKILDLRNSPCRREYKTAKEKKQLTRRSFHTRTLSCT